MPTHIHWDSPLRIADEYASGCSYKAALGRRGLFEQNKVNERFYLGDQWHGVQSSAERPLVRENIIKRIGDYKMSIIDSSPVTVQYSADGVPNTLDTQKTIGQLRTRLAQGEAPPVLAPEDEINLAMSALSDYFNTTARRLRFDELKNRLLQHAYLFGTGILYTYWDDRLKTGLYADRARSMPIPGDIACEILDVENVCFGDPSIEDIQRQPYILVAQRRDLADIRREMKRYGRTVEARDLRPDDGTDSGELPDAGKATVITKFYREWSENGSDSVIRAVRVCGKVTVRPAWSLGVRLYPLAAFRWEQRRRCLYGESEITHLIPNQIAINRMVTASVWAVMMMGIPIMVVNGDVVPQKVTNDPGQIIRVYGDGEDVESAIHYVQPPAFSPQFDANIDSLISHTMSQSGANDAALGNLSSENASAIVALREAATMPMQTMQRRFTHFIEDVARIWAEFWVTQYGPRSLKIEDDSGVWYLPFDGRRFCDLIVSVRADVGASTIWSEAQSVQTLDNLFSKGMIDVKQYLSRLPSGTIPRLSALIRELTDELPLSEDNSDRASTQPAKEEVPCSPTPTSGKAAV